MDFPAAADDRTKIKEMENADKLIDLARELNRQWKRSVTVMQIVDNAFGMVPKGLEKRLNELKIRSRMVTLRTTAFL